jgi:hypothetical protein
MNPDNPLFGLFKKPEDETNPLRSLFTSQLNIDSPEPIEPKTNPSSEELMKLVPTPEPKPIPELGWNKPSEFQMERPTPQGQGSIDTSKPIMPAGEAPQLLKDVGKGALKDLDIAMTYLKPIAVPIQQVLKKGVQLFSPSGEFKPSQVLETAKSIPPTLGAEILRPVKELLTPEAQANVTAMEKQSGEGFTQQMLDKGYSKVLSYALGGTLDLAPYLISPESAVKILQKGGQEAVNLVEKTNEALNLAKAYGTDIDVKNLTEILKISENPEAGFAGFKPRGTPNDKVSMLEDILKKPLVKGQLAQGLVKINTVSIDEARNIAKQLIDKGYKDVSAEATKTGAFYVGLEKSPHNMQIAKGEPLKPIEPVPIEAGKGIEIPPPTTDIRAYNDWRNKVGEYEAERFERINTSDVNRLSSLDKNGGQWKTYERDNPVLKNNPKEIIIYRATIGEEFKPGDYIYLNKKMVLEHQKAIEEPGTKILSQKVSLDSITGGQDSTEFIYNPKGIPPSKMTPKALRAMTPEAGFAGFKPKKSLKEEEFPNAGKEFAEGGKIPPEKPPVPPSIVEPPKPPITPEAELPIPKEPSKAKVEAGKVITKDYVYHNTAERHLESIANNGLTKNEAGIYPHGIKERPDLDTKQMIYFSDKETRAKEFGGRGNTLLRVRKSELNPKDIYEYKSFKNIETRYWGNDIAPDKIEIEINGEWKPLKEYVSEDLGIKLEKSTTPIAKIEGVIPPEKPPVPPSEPDFSKNQYVKNEPINIDLGKSDKEAGKNMVSEYVGVRNAQITRGNQLAREIKNEVPNITERQGMFWYKAANGDKAIIEEALKNPVYKEYYPQFEAALNLSEKAKANLNKVSQYYTESGVVAQDIGTIRNVRENYMNRIYKPEPPVDYVKTEQARGLQQTTSHAKSRVFDTEFDALAGGKKFATTDIADALSVHNEEMARVNTARSLADTMVNNDIGAWHRPDNIPEGWVKVGNLQKSIPIRDAEGKAVIGEGGNQVHSVSVFTAPKGIAKALSVIVDPNFTNKIELLKGIQKYQGLVKTGKLSFSMFHHWAITHQILTSKGISAFKDLPQLMEKLTGGEFKLMEEDFARHNGITTLLSDNQDVMRNLVDKEATLYGKITNLPGIKQVLKGAEWNSDLLFDKYQRYFKVMTYQKEVTGWLGSHLNATDTEIALAKKSIAKGINNLYGGLNWETLGINKTNQSLLRLSLLAPDWTYSNLSTIGHAFTSGSPAGAIARRNLFLCLTGGMILTEGLNYWLTGHFTDKNKKGHEFEVEVSPNVYMSPIRGAPYEILRLIANVYDSGVEGVTRFLMGKVSPLASTGIGLTSGVDYTGKSIFTGKPLYAKNTTGAFGKTFNAAKFVALNSSPIPISAPNIVTYLNNTPNPTIEGALGLLTGLARYSFSKNQQVNWGAGENTLKDLFKQPKSQNPLYELFKNK